MLERADSVMRIKGSPAWQSFTASALNSSVNVRLFRRCFIEHSSRTMRYLGCPPNGSGSGLSLFSKKQPIVEPSDMIYAKAIGLMAGVGLSVSLDLETNSLFDKTKIG